LGPAGAGSSIGDSSVAGGVLVERENPRLLEANLRVGSRLFAAAMAFMFMAFVFAFFYLRALNSNGDFRPAHVHPKQGYGIAILAAIVVGAVAFDLARRTFVTGAEAAWRAGAVLTLLLGLAAVAVQCYQYTRLGFGPTDGGYASVFVGWTGLLALFEFGVMYSVETLVAQSLRGDPPAGVGDDIERPSALLRPAADACAVLLYLMAGVEVFAFVLLYVVK
jgi:heme/copper-type cytochrome/quinol oxidase subunit 3